jgi:hypothetical protein
VVIDIDSVPIFSKDIPIEEAYHFDEALIFVTHHTG